MALVSASDVDDIRFKFTPTSDFNLSGTFAENYEQEYLDKEYVDSAQNLGLSDVGNGDVFDCLMRVITSGTCTPILFR